MSRGLGGPSPVGMVSASSPETPASLACRRQQDMRRKPEVAPVFSCWWVQSLQGSMSSFPPPNLRPTSASWGGRKRPAEDVEHPWCSAEAFFCFFIPWFKSLWPKALAVPHSQWPSTTLPVTTLTHTSPASPDFVPEPGRKQNPAEGPQGLAVGVKQLQGLRC